jgi:hypothetical protein
LTGLNRSGDLGSNGCGLRGAAEPGRAAAGNGRLSPMGRAASSAPAPPEVAALSEVCLVKRGTAPADGAGDGPGDSVAPK